MLATWHPKDPGIVKTEDSHVNNLVQDESNSNTDTEQQPTVIEEAVSIFDTIDKALVNVRM